ncbi:hypothetical protein [Halapricum desulfuricans]|uniref:Uncharacterized protein n=1 Tax=Halapricum desulfuricans TaxID=2841257 RepID=A0A897NCQ7_9EURY|nr:hypothetical protein [Halapricum desulfuricans]QSG10442.1 hypothetical protein HSR122_3074 [Halapricum desulfuricans]QSG13410.1 hypothetical protein HSBGL_3017 [Halapricum desulfuricans]
MKRLPFDRRQRIVAVLAVVAVSVGSIAAVQATASQTVPASTGDTCEYDTYSPPELDVSWTQSYKDGLSNGSERD